MELYAANRQWATRPADEKFNTLDAMHAATKSYADAARVKDVAWGDLRVEAQGDEMALIGKAGVPARLTNYAFGQIAQRIAAPASYLRTLPATLAAQNLNHGLKERAGGVARLLFHENGSLMLRAATSNVYERVWNHEVIARLRDLAERENLVPARQTMNWGGGELAPEAERPASLYASDHDMFAFMMSADRSIAHPTAKGTAMHRGIIVTNSEVGDASLGVQGFWFVDVCANHIIWGAQDLIEVRLRHVGQIREKWGEVAVRVRRYLDAGTSADAAAFTELSTRLIATTKDEVLDAVFGKRILPRVRIDEAFDAVVEAQDGDARTPWGLAAGITRLSQGPHADERTDLDRAAARVLSAF